jgi:transposase
VESTVLVAQRWILARLRNRTFFDLGELNEAIWELLDQLNSRPLQKLRVSRRELWERLDRPALSPLPVTPYELAQWKSCGVNIDYHVEVDHRFYSVPYQLVHEQVEVRYTASIVEAYYKGHRVASHTRRYDRGPATLSEHMPSSHRAHAEWTPSRLIRWAEKTGPAAGRLVAGILRSRPHPEQGYRACLGIMRLGRHHGDERLEAACARAERLRSYSYRTVKNILASAQDRLPLEDEPAAPAPTPSHHNIRGPQHYAAEETNEC